MIKDLLTRPLTAEEVGYISDGGHDLDAPRPHFYEWSYIRDESGKTIQVCKPCTGPCHYSAFHTEDLKATLKEGDELWHFVQPARPSGYGYFWGIALLRRGKVISSVVTAHD